MYLSIILNEEIVRNRIEKIVNDFKCSFLKTTKNIVFVADYLNILRPTSKRYLLCLPLDREAVSQIITSTS